MESWRFGRFAWLHSKSRAKDNPIRMATGELYDVF